MGWGGGGVHISQHACGSHPEVRGPLQVVVLDTPLADTGVLLSTGQRAPMTSF